MILLVQSPYVVAISSSIERAINALPVNNDLIKEYIIGL
jgi:hypothetical protein